MSSKYPSIPLTLADVRQLLLELDPYLHNITVHVHLAPHANDAARLAVNLSGYRRAVRLGEKPRVNYSSYVDSNRKTTLDYAVYNLLWQAWQDCMYDPKYQGTYTALLPDVSKTE